MDTPPDVAVVELNLPGIAFVYLSVRETDILRLVARGLTDGEIGRRLDLRPKTVHEYVSNVIGKLQAAARTELMLRARDAGLTPR